MYKVKKKSAMQNCSVCFVISLLIIGVILSGCDDKPPVPQYYVYPIFPGAGGTVGLFEYISCQGGCSQWAQWIEGEVHSPVGQIRAQHGVQGSDFITMPQVYIDMEGQWSHGYICSWYFPGEDPLVASGIFNFGAYPFAKPDPIVFSLHNASQEKIDDYFTNQVILVLNMIHDDGHASAYDYEYFENKIGELETGHLSLLVYLFEIASPELIDGIYYEELEKYVSFSLSEFHAYIDDLYHHAKDILQEEGMYMEHAQYADGEIIFDEIGEKDVPEYFSMQQNYPNPFNPVTNISYTLPVGIEVLLEIYNISGEKIRTLVDEYHIAGTHTVSWDGTNNNGAIVPSGIYIYKIQAGNYSESKRMMFLK